MSTHSHFVGKTECRIHGFTSGGGGILGRAEDVMEWGIITTGKGFPGPHWGAFVKKNTNE